MKTLPLSESTARLLIKVMREYGLSEFARENSLSPDHFLTQLSDNQWTPLHYAVFSGRLGAVKEALQPSGALFSSKHLLTKDQIGRTPLGLAAVRGNLDEVFVPSYWVGRVGEMEKLWKNVPERHRDEIDYPTLRAEAILMSVRAGVRIPLLDLWGARRSLALHFLKETPEPQQERR